VTSFDKITGMEICFFSFFNRDRLPFGSDRAYWLSKKWCVHRHRKQYLSFGYSFV